METNRLAIRNFIEEDFEDLYEYLSDEEVVKYEPYEVKTIDECKQIARDRANSNDFFAVCLKEENEKVIGNIYFAKIDPDEIETYEVGYVFNKKYWRNGYAREALKSVINYAFGELNVRRITAMCNPMNEASWRLLESVGMRREGHLRKNIFFFRDENKNPIWQDTYMYALLSEEK